MVLFKLIVKPQGESPSCTDIELSCGFCWHLNFFSFYLCLLPQTIWDIDECALATPTRRLSEEQDRKS